MNKFMQCLAVLCVLSTGAYADVIKLRADYFCPYNCNPQDAQPGLIVDAARIIFEKAGHQIDYQVIPYGDALNGTLAGDFDGVIGVEQEEAPTLIYPKEDFGSLKNVILAKKGLGWRYNGAASLQNVLIVALANYIYGEPFDSYIARNRTDPSKVMFIYGSFGVQQGVRMLESIDDVIFIDDVSIINYHLKNAGKLREFTQTPVNLPPIPIFIGFSPKSVNSDKYAQILSDGLAEMKKSGEWDKLQERYQIVK